MNVPRRRQALVVGLLLSVGLTGCGGGGSADAKDAAPQATPSRLSMPSGDAQLEAGTYLASRDASSAVAYTVTFPAGWHVQGGNEYSIHGDAPGGVGILPFLVDQIYTDACLGDGAGVTKVGPRPRDLVDALLVQVGPDKSSPVQTTLGGYPATRIDLRVPLSLQAKNCFLGPGTGVQIWQSPQDRYLVLGPLGMASVYIVDVDGQRQVFTAQYDPARISKADLANLQQILASIRIEAPGR